MNNDAIGKREHARLIRRADGGEAIIEEGSLSDMASALFSLSEDERGYYVVETIEGRFEESDLITKLQSGELEG